MAILGEVYSLNGSRVRIKGTVGLDVVDMVNYERTGPMSVNRCLDFVPDFSAGKNDPIVDIVIDAHTSLHMIRCDLDYIMIILFLSFNSYFISNILQINVKSSICRASF